MASPLPEGHAASLLLLRELVGGGRALASRDILAALEEIPFSGG